MRRWRNWLGQRFHLFVASLHCTGGLGTRQTIFASAQIGDTLAELAIIYPLNSLLSFSGITEVCQEELIIDWCHSSH